MKKKKNTKLEHWTVTGIDLSAKHGSLEEYPVMGAVITGDLSKIQEILEQVPKKHKRRVLNVKDYNEYTALDYTAMSTRMTRMEKKAVCELLIQNGAIADTQYREIWERYDAAEAAKAAKAASLITTCNPHAYYMQSR